jgi:hypothetical protein
LLHHLVDHAAKEEGVGLVEDFGCATKQVLVRGNAGAMIAAPVQGEVDGIAKGSHCDPLYRRVGGG